ncbi:MAG: peptidoglycan-binding protein [Acidobacteriota bacterium]|nr:peptidoglycan-binding protein [Acidobacteriota bacterium]
MASGFISLDDDGECRALSLAGTQSKKGGVISIIASVGINGVNKRDDVSTIQQALNDVPLDQGQPIPLLVVDGICGSKTKNAIQKFQVKHFGWGAADGRVDAGGLTIAKLNQLNSGSSVLIYEATPGSSAGKRSHEVDPIIGAARVARIRGLIGAARNCIRAALQNATMALPVVNSTSGAGGGIGWFNRESRMELLNRHFDVDLHPQKDRRAVVETIIKTFTTMESVFIRPGGLWGAAVFDYDRLGIKQKSYAYAYGQGYYNSGKIFWTAKGAVRCDTIYLCPRLDNATDDVGTMAIVHELAHFVGHPETIIDYAYGWIDAPKMKRLVPWQKLYNAMNYGNYAFDAQYGRRPAGY